MCAGAGGRRRFRKVPVQGQVQVAGAGSRRFQKVPEGSGAGQGQVACAGSRRFRKVSEGSGRFRKVPEGSGRFRYRARCKLQAQVPEGPGGL